MVTPPDEVAAARRTTLPGAAATVMAWLVPLPMPVAAFIDNRPPASVIVPAVWMIDAPAAR